MLKHRTSVICTSLLLLLLLTSCGTSSSSTPTPNVAPAHYTSHVYYQGTSNPDDLVFDLQGHILFSDGYHGTVGRINADGTVTLLVTGLKRPEGLVMLPNGTLIIAEQQTNRILSLTPGAHSVTILRQLPGSVGAGSCKNGTNGITYNAVNQTILVPDSPTGNLYSLSTDGKTLILLASGMATPDSAVVDSRGDIYIDVECGGSIWRLDIGGTITKYGGFGMLDDIVFDPHGNLLLTDVSSSIHALIRFNLATGQRVTLASQGYEKPEGLLVDAKDNIYLADDDIGKVVEYIPAS
jgi:sugar lactone lactonase YvrE